MIRVMAKAVMPLTSNAGKYSAKLMPTNAIHGHHPIADPRGRYRAAPPRHGLGARIRILSAALLLGFSALALADKEKPKDAATFDDSSAMLTENEAGKEKKTTIT